MSRRTAARHSKNHAPQQITTSTYATGTVEGYALTDGTGLVFAGLDRRFRNQCTGARLDLSPV
jgi:hypothetical protein